MWKVEFSRFHSTSPVYSKNGQLGFDIIETRRGSVDRSIECHLVFIGFMFVRLSKPLSVANGSRLEMSLSVADVGSLATL